MEIDISKKLPIGIVVFASGSGSNFQAIINTFKKSKKVEIKALFTDNPNAYAIKRAKVNGIPYEVFIESMYKSREEFDRHMFKALERYSPDLIVLAGYLKVIKYRGFFEKYRYRILNIHPALLPAFKGTIHAQKEAFEYGCKVSGLTIHFVTDDVDGGPIIYQKCVDISKCKTPEEVAKRIIRYEHIAYPKVIGMFADGKFVIEGRRVMYVKNEGEKSIQDN